MAGTISITGLATSLNTEAIIEKLMAVERIPEARLQQREGQVKARETDLQGILAKLREVSSSLQALRSPTLWENVQTVSSSSTAVSAEMNGGAGAGGYQVEVTQLARAAQKTFEFTPSEVASQLVVDGQTIELGAGATLADAVTAINSDPEAGVAAVAVGGKLVLSSKTTGAEATITAEGATISEEAAKAKEGLNALYTVDGVAGSSASNVLSEAIPGVTLTLGAVTTGPVTIDVSEPTADTASIAAKVKSFVAAYNAAVEAIEAKVGEEPVREPKTSEEANRGVLFGDNSLESLLGQMRQALSESGLGKLGVSTGAPSATVTADSASVRGLLTFEESKLAALLKSEPAAARAAISGTEGFATVLEPIVGAATAPSGGISERIGAATKEAALLREQMTALEERLALREKRLHAQFTAMETALARSKSESNWLTGQLKSLGG